MINRKVASTKQFRKVRDMKIGLLQKANVSIQSVQLP